VISDAGEMAMNAALAQYNASLLDEYGLLVMDKDPSAYVSEIENFFNRSLSASGLPDEEEYSRLLDLVAEQVDAFAVQGSEIYRTEVERQQIIEYMKYRAPLCLVDLVLEKLDAMKDTKKKAEAVKAQMEFAGAMKQCQDAIDEAYEALKILEQNNDNFRSAYSSPQDPTPLQYIQTNGLEAAMYYYRTELTKTHLMIVAISRYEETASGDLESMAKSFTDAAAGVDVNNAPGCFEQYLSCLYYQRGVQSAGGAQKIVDDWKSEHPEPPETEEIPVSERTPGSTETTRETAEHIAWVEQLKEKEEIVSAYDDAETSISDYNDKLRAYALSIINDYSGPLAQCSAQAGVVGQSADKALEKLEALMPLIEEAQNKWQNWSDKEKEAFDENDRSADEYKDFFSQEDVDKYEALVQKVQGIIDFYAKLVPKLAEETFCGKALSEDSEADQYGAQHSRAEEILSGVEITASGFRPGDYTETFKADYNHVILSDTVPPWSEYSDDAFYEKLKNYRTDETKVDQDKKTEANETLSQSTEAGKEADEDAGYPDFNWDSVENADAVLPSRILNAASEQGNSDMTGVGGNVDDDESTLKSFMASISAATSFLDGLDRILSDALEDLYIAEYTMQMFSYYTVDRNQDGTVKAPEDIITLSGYMMSADSRRAYRAEAEYVLWGNADSKKNVQAVVMTLFGIRLLFNTIFTFTDSGMRTSAQTLAHAICGPAQFLVPIVQTLIQLGYASIETAHDIKCLKEGYGVTVVKNKDSWSTGLYYKPDQEKAYTRGITLRYDEYMRIFFLLRMLVYGDKDILARIADCIQVNNEFDLLKGYTMVSISATVKSRTSFMRRISDMEGGPGLWSYADDYYSISYQSVLGY